MIFANFVCTFGDKGGFLDFSDITLPAFFTDTFIRKYGSNNYHLYDVNLVKLDEVSGEPVLGISGRFVKNTILTREQIFDDETGIVKSHLSMPSSPSAYFLLILNTHRLIYLAETGHAPDVKSFEATMANFIKRVREARIAERYQRGANGTTKKALQDSLPRPSLRILPLAEQEKIADYIQRFSLIQSVRFRLIRPNHETDASEVVAAVRGRFGSLHPDKLDIIATSNVGLDKSEVAQAVQEAVETGNTDIQLKGEDQDKSRIRGSNDEFALTVDLPNPASDDAGRTKQLYELYSKLLALGKIKIGSRLGHVGEKIRTLASGL